MAASPLVSGATFTITTRDVEGNDQIVSTTFRGLPWDLNPGDRILLDDGNIECQVKETTDTDVVVTVTNGGVLKSRKGINLPGIIVNVPSLNEKDRADLIFGLEHGVDYVAISFVQRAQDVIDVRRAIQKINPAKSNTPIIAKLEKPAALENLEAILDASDGVMVARGDMGVELSPQVVPSAQKRIIEAANAKGKIVITATQMLESMINNPRPTRAEASDVANAIFDGTDVVMLSAETASGQYPVESVKMMALIAEEAEIHEKIGGTSARCTTLLPLTPSLSPAPRANSRVIATWKRLQFLLEPATARASSPKNVPALRCLPSRPNPKRIRVWR